MIRSSALRNSVLSVITQHKNVPVLTWSWAEIYGNSHVCCIDRASGIVGSLSNRGADDDDNHDSPVAVAADSPLLRLQRGPTN